MMGRFLLMLAGCVALVSCVAPKVERVKLPVVAPTMGAP